MEYDPIIFWFLVISCVSGLLTLIFRMRSFLSGWTVLYAGILVISLIGRFWAGSVLIYVGLGFWLLLIVLPALLGRLFYREHLKQRFRNAERLAHVIRWLHPMDGWTRQPGIIRALRLAQQGDVATATEMLKQFDGTKSLMGLTARINLYRLTSQWEELLAWQEKYHLELDRHPQFLPVLLRAYGETGDLDGLVTLYDINQGQISRLVPATSRDLCRLVLFAFCGERSLVEQLLEGSLAILPAWTAEFWRATADLAAGDSESGKRRLKPLLITDDQSIRRAVERRLAMPVSTDRPSFTPEVIAQAARDQGHDESYGGQASLFSRRAIGTQLLVALNLAMFIAEIYFGGATNSKTLYQLGALFPPAVREGQWWRLVTSLFLHLGPLHLSMNMLALWLLGPFTERAVGLWRYLAIYLLAGVGSMWAVMLFASGPNRDQLTLGASGCVMGLVGATGALMLRGWLRERALSAKRRLVAMLVIVVTQTTFDLMIPQVSMTAHLSGALIGFVVTFLLPNRRVTRVSGEGTGAR